MSVTFTRVLAIAATTDTDATPKSLLTLGTANPKVGKGEKRGYRTAIMHLSPANLAGFEVCAGRTVGCTAACLNTAGRGSMDTAKPSAIHVARLRRTRFFKRDRNAFGLMLERELAAHVKSANRAGMIPVARLNGTSDLPWENVSFTWADGSRSTVFDRFPTTWRLASDEGDAGSRETIGNTHLADLIADRRGEKRDTWRKALWRILNQEAVTTSISMVDEFFVELGRQYLWYSPPLSDFYFSQEILDMPESDCGDLMFFQCCGRWGTVQQKVPGPSRQCRGCRRKYQATWKVAA